jgi:hypothetical protein
MFSHGICWSGLTVNLCGSEVQALQMNSQGMRHGLSLPAKMQTAPFNKGSATRQRR